jgi:hypothetical protein
MLFLANKILKKYKPLVVRMNARGDTGKKSRKYVSKKYKVQYIGCWVKIIS